VIVELRAQLGRRAELSSLLKSLVTTHGPNEHRFLGSRRDEVLDDLDVGVPT
jgi:hypothetical protein